MEETTLTEGRNGPCPSIRYTDAEESKWRKHEKR